ncbi:Hypothetical protein LUCI_2654 [Lucifera butyrica]|uniref:LUD domain-containing protein n=1 Tax=Lucifera butyrica TaxID=1351585 RepID=A0A498RDZ3_9FIRM|nr:lactate utilization protein [Lucifera butyrica]VBB07408.1 Hypothetical protein LUCI_2654 [Lucifera butyrica]
MSQFTEWHNDLLGEKVVQALIKNNFSAAYVKTRQEACQQILALIPPEATIGMGGSWTVKELGLDEALEVRGNPIFNHNKPGLTPAEAAELRRRQLTADVFLTGTNTVTLDGKLVNVDGNGNRVAAMIYGPKKVIVIAGINKIVKDVEAAERRIEQYAAPINNKRLGRPNPCVQTGVCMDCQLPTRICNVTTILRKRPSATDIHVVVVGEELGF